MHGMLFLEINNINKNKVFRVSALQKRRYKLFSNYKLGNRLPEHKP